jgi:glycosyltransferase involved in cell wall biosynthesis
MNILLVTGHFPSYDCPGKTYATQFLYNYAYEWVKMGHTVHVIHFCRKYPPLFNSAAGILGKIGYSGLKKFIVPPEAQTDKDYLYNGVFIHRRNYMKYIPHGKAGKQTLKKLCSQTEKIIAENMPEQDILIGDCLDPVLHVIKHCASILATKQLQIIHDTDFSFLKNSELCTTLKNVPCLLIRSRKQLPQITSFIGDHKYTYMYSGIPETAVDEKPVYRTAVKKLVYVGALYKSKGLETVLRAVSKAAPSMSLEVLGDGADAEYFKNLVSELNISHLVSFIGKVPHEEVFPYMKKADALVLISRETFGMVYVEAMSQGCIPIGAVNEGIDGVVINNENGFLVPLGDVDALTDLFMSLASTPCNEIQRISENAYLTAAKMTDKKLAQNLLEEISG